MLKKVLSIMLIVITLIIAAKAVSFVMVHVPETSEELVVVTRTFDNIVEVERNDGNIYSCYGTTDDVVLVGKFCDDKLVDLNPVKYYTIGEIKDMAEASDIYYIVKNSHLDKLNPDDYQDSQCVGAGVIDDIDTFGYCFFI